MLNVVVPSQMLHFSKSSFSLFGEGMAAGSNYAGHFQNHSRRNSLQGTLIFGRAKEEDFSIVIDFNQ